MTKRPLLLIFFLVLLFWLSCYVRATEKAAPPPAVQANAADHSRGTQRLSDNGNLPESASALPLLSAIGAGALLGGLLSARRTRSGR